MKRYLVVVTALALILGLGCTPQQEPEDVPPPPKAPAAKQESAGEIVENYGKGLTSSMDKAGTAQARVDIRDVQRAIQGYAVDNDGTLPKSLDDISDRVSAGMDLSVFDYDPATGVVKIK